MTVATVPVMQTELAQYLVCTANRTRLSRLVPEDIFSELKDGCLVTMSLEPGAMAVYAIWDNGRAAFHSGDPSEPVQWGDWYSGDYRDFTPDGTEGFIGLKWLPEIKQPFGG